MWNNWGIAYTYLGRGVPVGLGDAAGEVKEKKLW